MWFPVGRWPGSVARRLRRHRIKDGVIDLNLLRSVKYVADVVPPGEGDASDEPNDHFTNQTDHEFTCALYPHPGDHVEGRVVEAAYELNVPLRATPLTKRGEPAVAREAMLPPAASFLEVDVANVMVEAVKRAEDGDDLVLRLYQTSRRGTLASLRFGFDLEAAAEVDLLEEQPAPLDIEDRRLVTLVFLPFGIKTLRVSPAGRGE